MRVLVVAALLLLAQLPVGRPCWAQRPPPGDADGDSTAGPAGDGTLAPAGVPPSETQVPPSGPLETPPSDDALENARRPPLHVDYLAYGVAVTADLLADAGATCRQEASTPTPCILGSGGGLVLRGGYRSPGPWYIGGAYQFSTTDSDNLYRLGILQQLRAEMRYLFDFGYRTAPYATWGVGGVVYGNEWGVETGGGSAFVGAGFETQLSRLVLLGMAIQYQPVVFAGFTDTANYERDPGLAHYFRIELQLEIRSELSRE